MNDCSKDSHESRPAQFLQLACLLEATARKPGNVHPQASFEDLCYRDFVISARAAAPILAAAPERGIGRTILEAVTATQEAVGRNTNLGMVLLLAPLAAVHPDESLADGIAAVLAESTREDAALVYRAVRSADPGGMGDVSQEDIAAEPMVTLLEAMRLAANRDRIAEQYANNFQLILDVGVPYLARCDDFSRGWERAVVGLHLRLMADFPDTLIARKCGAETAAASAQRAQQVLEAGWPETAGGKQTFQDLDRWLRADGNRRNPGTSADVTAASLFAALREGLIAPPTSAAISPNVKNMWTDESGLLS